jgi:L-threonylcarbamoyladenylate synthase
MCRMVQNMLSNNSFTITPASEENILRAAALLHQHALVAFPTETVYGLGGNACSDEAIAAIYRTKGRPAHNPLIIHVADAEMAEQYGVMTRSALELAETYFPAPLTLVVPVRAGTVAAGALGGGGTVALRCPTHPVAQALIRAFNVGIAAPSANRSGRISPTAATHVWEEFAEEAGSLRMILDGGACGIGLESTVVDCSGEVARILRTGSISAEAIAQVVPLDDEMQVGTLLKSPGLLASHYAPNARVRLNAHEVGSEEALLAFGGDVPIGAKHMINLSPAGDMEEAAFHFYDYLRKLDRAGVFTIAVMPIPERGIGVALNDRLRRAAAAR